MDEKKFLDNVADTYVFDSQSDNWRRDAYIDIYEKYLGKDSYALEMGCSDGYTSERISRLVKKLDVIDGSQKMLSHLEERIQKGNITNITPIYALFEELNVENCYDAICCSYVLEHVNDPVEILKIAKKALKNDGVMMITVPNAKALSRQLALHMGLIDNLYDLTENDNNHGHRRVYDMDKLGKDVIEAGFTILDRGGTFVKQFADFQLDQMMKAGIIGDAQIEGMKKLAKDYPDISGSIYMILKKN